MERSTAYTSLLAHKLIDLGNLMFLVMIVGALYRPGAVEVLLFPVSVMLMAWGVGGYLLVKRSP